VIGDNEFALIIMQTFVKEIRRCCLVPQAQEPGVTLMSVFPTCVLCLGFGLSAHQAPYYFIEAARGFGMTPSEGLALGAVSVHLVAMAAPWLLQR